MNVALNDIIEVVVRCQLNDQAGINVRHFRASAVVGLVTYDQIAQGVATTLEPNYTDLMCDPSLFIRCSARRVKPLPHTPFTDSADLDVNGTAGADPAPSQCTGIISFYSDVAGRKGRGRAYIPFPSTSSVDADGKPVAGYLTNILALANVMSSVITVAPGGASVDLTPVIFHRTLATSDDITRVKTPAKFATQRRRGAYGRPNPI